jgi:hypothetical protein
MKSKSARSLRELPAKAVRRKTADGIKGGFEATEHGGKRGIYMNFDNIKDGEVTEQNHLSWIDFYSY